MIAVLSTVGIALGAGMGLGWHAHRIYVADLKNAVRRATSKRR